MLQKEEFHSKLNEIYYTYFIECMLFGRRTSYFSSNDFRIKANQIIFLEQLALFVKQAIDC